MVISVLETTTTADEATSGTTIGNSIGNGLAGKLLETQ